jgi:hypothetical protein
MLKDAELPLELWDEAARAESYLRNRTSVGPEVDGQRITPEEMWTGVKPSIDHIYVWGCKCFSYVNPKSLPASGRQDKFMDRGRIAIFVGYEESTTCQYRIYSPDLRYVTRSTVVTFDETQKGGTVDLRICTTPNVLPERAPRGRPRRDLPESDHIEENHLAVPGTAKLLNSIKPTIEVVLPRRSPEFDNISAEMDISEHSKDMSNRT